jgi:hypothetical protein
MNGAWPLRRIAAVAAVGAVAHAAWVYLFRRQRCRYAGQRRHILVTQGGQRLRVSGSEINDAVVSVLMGGAILDLRDERPRPGPARLEVLVVMGGVQLFVPEDWNVRVEVEAALGGVDDRRVGAIGEDRPPDLVISGRVIMGGLELLTSCH